MSNGRNKSLLRALQEIKLAELRLKALKDTMKNKLPDELYVEIGSFFARLNPIYRPVSPVGFGNSRGNRTPPRTPSPLRNEQQIRRGEAAPHTPLREMAASGNEPALTSPQERALRTSPSIAQNT